MQRERIPQWIRNIVEIEKGAICGICGKPINFGEAYEIDHIYPISKGGSCTLDNFHVAHKSCNRKKGDKNIMANPDQWKVWWNLIEPNLGKLWDNQLRAYRNTIDRLLNIEKYPNKEYRIYPGGRPKIYCECTGAGKSILMLVLGFLLARKRVLIVTPSRVIRKNDFDALNDAYDIGIIPEKVFKEIKMTSLDKEHPLAWIHTADIVISTYQKLGKHDSDRVLANLDGTEFDVILIDEAHHYKEDEKYEKTIHRDIVSKFKNATILFFTATPFDANLNPILKNFDKDKDVIHEFNYADAWHKGYVKYFEWTEIKPEEQTLIITHPNGRTETMQLREEGLKEASKIVGYKAALSKSKAIKISLIYATVHLLDLRNDELRNKAKKNIALMIFPNKKEAEDCYALMDTLNLKYDYCLIHSDVKNREELINNIKKDVYDIILSVDILKEGFDQKNITIVTLARKIESYVFFTQVIGRGVRARKDIYGKPIPVSGPIQHMKDICYVITHEGLGLRRFWDLFRELDLRDLVDEQEEKEMERRERGELTEIIEEVSPIISIEDERVSRKGYLSDGFDKGRTPRDETEAWFTMQAAIESGETNLRKAMEEIWNRDNGKSSARIENIKRTIKYSTLRNIPIVINDKNIEKKVDIQIETMNIVKKLQTLLKSHLRKYLNRKPTTEEYKLLFDTFFKIHHYPLKGGSSDTGYRFGPSVINSIQKEVPILIEKYHDYNYFLTYFIPVYKELWRKKMEISLFS